MLQSAALAVLTLTGIDHRRARARAPGRPGDHQRVRHAGAPGVRRRDGRGPRGPAERHRAQLVDGERRAASSARRSAASIIAAVGEGWCFVIDAVSYLAVIASLLAMRVAPRDARRRADDARARGARARRSLRRAASCPIRTALLLLALVSLDRHAVHGAHAGDLRRTCCTAGRTRSAFS